MNKATSVHDLTRNDTQAAVALLERLAEQGPVGRDTLEMMAMLQDNPRDFYDAIAGVDFDVKP
jgi:hypothetical protein